MRLSKNSEPCVEIFSMAKNTWEIGPYLPSCLEHSIARIPEGSGGGGGDDDVRIFLTCGALAESTELSFSAARNAWSVVDRPSLAVQQSFLSTLPSRLPPTARRRRAGTAVVGHQVFVMGGHSTGFSSTVDVFDVRTNTWDDAAGRAIPDMPTARYDFGVVVVDDHRIITIGGYNGVQVANVEALDTVTSTWEKLASMPTARQGAAVALIGRCVWVLGGLTKAHGYTDIIEVFDVDKNEWTVSPFVLPKPRYTARAVVVEGEKIWLVGGAMPNRSEVVEIFDPATGEFTSAPPMMGKRKWHAVIGF
jgi:hypothetical protein